MEELRRWLQARRWPRALLALVVYFLLVVWVAGGILQDSVFASPSIAKTDGKRIVLGLSIIEGEPSSIQTPNINVTTNFWLQSQSPIAQIYLDYVAIHNDPDISPLVCIKSIHLAKNQTALLEAALDIIPTNPFGQLSDNSGEYVFIFDEEKCFEKGKNYYTPHLFLGIISVDAYVDLIFTKISGNHAFQFFPFDKQNLALDLSIRDSSNTPEIKPRLDVTISQQGWVGDFHTDKDDKTILSLSRPEFYRNMSIIFLIVLSFIAIYLNNIVKEASSFFEISFGLLLGLWGTHEILIPGYIDSSVPIDVGIYILYVFVIGEILVVFIDHLIIEREKHRIQIIKIEKGGIENECVEIENTSRIPIDMTSWTLSDEAGHKFKFPRFILQGHSRVKVWTLKKDRPVDNSKHFSWDRKQSVWNDTQDTAYLEDSKGEAIDHRAYSNER